MYVYPYPILRSSSQENTLDAHHNHLQQQWSQPEDLQRFKEVLDLDHCNPQCPNYGEPV